MKTELTAASIAALPGPADGAANVVHWDTKLPGFGLRISRGGLKVLVVNYRANGIERRASLKTVLPTMTTAKLNSVIRAARKEAERLRQQARHDGTDPLAEKHAERAAPTMADLVDRYRKEELPKRAPSTQKEYDRQLEADVLPAMKAMKVADVTLDDMADLHRNMTAKSGPVMANRTIALLSKLFSLAIKWKYRADNPCAHVERNTEFRRERYLSKDEITGLLDALDGQEANSANAIRLCLFTGARSGEVLGATWKQFDLKAGIWTKPARTTKQRKLHSVRLNEAALTVLRSMDKDAKEAAREARKPVAPYLFARANGEPQKKFRRLWATVCSEAGIEECVPHDLRHTFASMAIAAGVQLMGVGDLLGHSSTQTTARYVHLIDDSQRANAKAVGDAITAALVKTQ
jgi:integrase